MEDKTKRHINSITEAEAFEVAALVCQRHNRHYKPDEISYEMKSWFEVYLEINGYKSYVVQICIDGIGFVSAKVQGYSEQHYFAPNQYLVTQYLLSKGFNLGIGYDADDQQTAALKAENERLLMALRQIEFLKVSRHYSTIDKMAEIATTALNKTEQ